MADSKTVRVLADLLASLRADVAPVLDGALPPAMVSMRSVGGLRAEHVRNAMLSASLDPIQDEWTLPSALASALAASHIGLCRDYRFLPDCDSEEAEMPIRFALGIHYSNLTLSTTLNRFRSAPIATDFTQDIDWTLGHDAMPRPGAMVQHYWTRLRAAIQRLPHGTTRKITDALLMGDATSDERFQIVLRDALADILPRAFLPYTTSANLDSSGDAQSHQVQLDPTFVVARGAAILGKRQMEQPDGCVERSYCKWWRGERDSLGLEL